MEYRDLTVSSLIDRCSDKDPLAWAEFVNRFTRLIEFSIRKALVRYSNQGSAEDIKDIKQEIIISLWRRGKLAEIKNRQNINYWLIVTARNASLNYLKAKKRYVLKGDERYFERIPEGLGGREVHKSHQRKFEAAEKIKEIYNLLNAKEKIAFKLYFEKDLNARDISKMLKAPLGTITSTITRIRKKIKKCSRM